MSLISLEINLLAAEELVRKRGCNLLILGTMDWQAPKFHQKHDFTILDQLDDYPITGQK